MPTPKTPDGSRHEDPRAAKISCDADSPFEPTINTKSGSAVIAGTQSRVIRQTKRGRRISFAGFLGALALLLVTTPYVAELKGGQVYEAMLFTLVMCTGLVASGSWRRMNPLVFGLVIIALTGLWLHDLWPAKWPALMFIVPAMAFLALVIGCLLKFILRARQVDRDVLCAGISVYLILGLLWGLAYTLVAQTIPNAFSFTTSGATSASMNGFTSMYFSYSTLATLGYGDIAPVANAARMLAMLEAMTGILFVGVMIARLVSLYSAPRQRRPASHNPGQSANLTHPCNFLFN